jgi:hypothetical protein
MPNQVLSEVETDDQCEALLHSPRQPMVEEQELSDFHKDFLIRYMEVELKRQERVARNFLREQNNNIT